MASPQQLGAQLYNPFIPPSTNQQLQQIQQQQALAQSLLSEGLSPIKTDGRQIGGVGYKISPWEGAAKIGDILSGAYSQYNANDKMGDLANQSGGSSDPLSGMNLPAGIAQIVRYDSMNGDGRAAAELLSKFAGPTDLQKNLGLDGSGSAPAPIGGAPTSAQSTQPAPPIPAPPPPQTGGASGSWGNDPSGGINIPAPAPPEGAQAPIGAAAPIPPVNGSSLVGGALPNTAPVAPRLTGNALQQQAQIDAQKAGASKQAENLGGDLADATKTYNVMSTNLPRAMQRFSQLRQAAPNASSGGGVSDAAPEEPGFIDHFLPGPDYARNFARTSGGQYFEPKTAAANQVIEQAGKQGILNELGPQLQGLKGNKFLESIASGASGLNPSDPPDVKVNAVNGLQDQYISQMKAMAVQRQQLGDRNAPTDLTMAQQIAQHADPSTKISVIGPDGTNGRIDPKHLVELIQNGGKLR